MVVHPKYPKVTLKCAIQMCQLKLFDKVNDQNISKIQIEYSLSISCSIVGKPSKVESIGSKRKFLPRLTEFTSRYIEGLREFPGL